MKIYLHFTPSQAQALNPINSSRTCFYTETWGICLATCLDCFSLDHLLGQHVLGSKRFLIFYFVTGIGAGFLYTVINLYEMYELKQAVDLYSQYPSPEAFLDFLTRFAPDIKRSSLDFLNSFEEQPKNLSYINDSVAFVKNTVNTRLNIPMVGASGAIFGIIAAFGLIFPNMEMMLLFFPIPIKAKYFVTFYALYELYAGMNIQDSGVAHFAHLGGMIFAYILLKIWKIRRMH